MPDARESLHRHIETLEKHLDDSAHHGHEEYCFAVRGPDGEHWYKHDKCECSRRGALAALESLRQMTVSEIRNVGTSEQVPTDAHTDKYSEAMREALARLREGIDIPARVGARIADFIEQELNRSAELGRLALEADNILENAAIEAEGTFGRAHTYASENADIYRAQDHAIARAAKRIRAMKGRYAVSHGGIGACDMGQMCLDCQPRGPNGECPDATESGDDPTDGLAADFLRRTSTRSKA